MKKIFGFIILATMIFTPVVSINTAYAGGLVPDCGNVVKTADVDKDGKPILDAKGNPKVTSTITTPCNFDSLMDLINNIIDFLLFTLATPLVAIILCYAGFLLITSGGSSESRTKAKKMIKNVVIGYIIALAAWLIVHTILSTLGFTGPTSLKG